MDPVKHKLHRKQPENAFTKRKRTADKSLQPLPEEETYKDCHFENSSVWSPIMDLEERGRAKAGELWDVALEKGLKHYLI